MGEVFVFVDECHRTQNGRLHRVMKALMPNAVFIGLASANPEARKEALGLIDLLGRKGFLSFRELRN
jgi:type I restriction enzyme R subunit